MEECTVNCGFCHINIIIIIIRKSKHYENTKCMAGKEESSKCDSFFRIYEENDQKTKATIQMDDTICQIGEFNFSFHKKCTFNELVFGYLICCSKTKHQIHSI